MSTSININTVSEKDAAIYICMSRSFLRQGRMKNARESRTPTPPYLKIGRSVRYLIEDLDTWLGMFRQGGES